MANHLDPFEKGSRRLLVAASHGVFCLSSQGFTELFKSGSKGIVAATKTRPDDDILAVADSHVVVLHNMREGLQRTYRLKDSGPPRQLYYDRKDDRLLYTTALEPAVQVYSLKHQRFCEPATSHPSPPTLFAVHTSDSLNVLLSASARPPTIFVTSLDGHSNRAKCLVQPPCTDSACSAASFHPSVGPGPVTVLFALGFLDGTVAVYSYNTSCLEYDPPSQWEELASVKRVHVTTTEESPRRALRPASLAPKRSNARKAKNTCDLPAGVGDIATAVTAVALMPGYLCIAVSIGSDGRCCITDFEPDSGPVIVQQWNVQGSATALAVEKGVVTIGLRVGRVLLYNLAGELLFSQDLGSDHKIVDLEWTDFSPQSPQAHQYTANALKSTSADRENANPSTQPVFPKTVSEHQQPELFKRSPQSPKTEKGPTFLSQPITSPTQRRPGRASVSGGLSGAGIALSPTSVRYRKLQTTTDVRSHIGQGLQTSGNRNLKMSPRSADFQHPSSLSRSSSVSSNSTIRYASPGAAGQGSPAKLAGSSRLSMRPQPLPSKKDKEKIPRPVIPPRPARSPETPRAKPLRSLVHSPTMSEKPNDLDQRVQSLRPHDAAASSALVGSFDGAKDKGEKRATFLEPLPVRKVDITRRDSTSSSMYSDEYVLDWKQPDLTSRNEVENNTRHNLGAYRSSFAFRPPVDAVYQDASPLRPTKQGEPRQPVLKAPFPMTMQHSLPANTEQPVSPIIQDFGASGVPTVAPASKQYSDAKKARQSASPSKHNEEPPTPTRKRKQSFIDIDLLSNIPKQPSHPPPPTPATSSGAASSYVTARTQTEILDTDSTRRADSEDLQALIKEACNDLRKEVANLIDSHEANMLEVVLQGKEL